MRHMHVGEHICVFLEELGVFLQEMRNVFGGKTGVGHGWESSVSTVGRSASISIWPANTETADPLMTRSSPSQATVSVPPRALTRPGLSSRPRRRSSVAGRVGNGGVLPVRVRVSATRKHKRKAQQ